MKNLFSVLLLLGTVVTQITDAGSLATIDSSAILRSGANGSPGYVAHEWGTFTSVQGADGKLLPWNSVNVAELPRFVYNWSRPGLDPAPTLAVSADKGSLTTLQRMETPVIYFYADREQNVDVSVQFPRGFITEWYPQASVSGSRPLQMISIGAPQTAASVANDSRIEWSGVKITPASSDTRGLSLLAADTSGSHYFAARETDSDLLDVAAPDAPSPSETEKFLFYRGVGNFTTPLRVTMDAAGQVKLDNTGDGSLRHLFLLSLREGNGKLVSLNGLAAGQSREFQLNCEKELSTAQLRDAVERAMTDALVSEGLYPREAAAMVNTWKDTWFSEDGMRVLYVLPRSWTDVTLPVQFKPAPRELVRVMIGRAEVIEPSVVKQLHDELVDANRGNKDAVERADRILAKLGRFAVPARQLATVNPFE